MDERVLWDKCVPHLLFCETGLLQYGTSLFLFGTNTGQRTFWDSIGTAL